jgi:hypothetical protein
MSILIFALIVFIVVALVCWIIHLIPLPAGAPAATKQVAMAFIAAIGLIVILLRVPGIGYFP